MTTLIPEENTPPQPRQRARSRNRTKRLVLRHVAPTLRPPRPSRPARPRPPKKAPKGRTKREVAKPKVARDGSKTAKILDLLKRPGGATSKELMKATGWLPHSVRGFLSGTVRKKMGLTVTSTKGENGERTYSVEA